MKAFVFERPGSGSVRQIEAQRPGPGEVLVRVEVCGICGTDLHIWEGTEPAAHHIVLGHEYTGTIVEVGAGAAHRVGERVSVDPNIYCKQCEYCLTGEVNLCAHLKALGVDIHGGFAELCVVPETQIYTIPDYMTWEEAAMVEPLACAIHGIDRAEIKAGQTVLIIGGGPMGLLMVQLARLRGASKVMLSEKVAWRRSAGEAFGADQLFDPAQGPLAELIGEANLPKVVFECVGNPVTQAEAIRVVRRGGTVVLFGDGQVGKTFPVGSFDFYSKNMTVRGAALNPFTHSRAIQLLAEKRIRSDGFISRTVALEELPAILENGYQERDVKVLVAPRA